MNDRLELLKRARLYLVCDARPDEFLDAALAGGVDLVQLRMKDAADDEILGTAARFKAICARHGALLILNDRPDLAAAAGTDGVHVGQSDSSVSGARAAVGADRIVGLSTLSQKQIDAADGVDYIGVGPIHETPTKPGRPAVGPRLVSYAASRASVPFFAIGGITLANVGAVISAGGERVAVVRAITDARDPGEAARRLKRQLTAAQSREVPVGAT